VAKNHKVVAVLIVLVLIVLVIVGFITPGYLRYDFKEMDTGIFGVHEIRTDRFTGTTEIYGAGKWQPVKVNGNGVDLPAGTTIEVN
jgi:hypothetical protein